MINSHRRFAYHKTEEPRIFEKGEDIPTGWYDSPALDDPRTKHLGGEVSKNQVYEPQKEKKYPSQMNKEELVELGNDLGADVDGKTKPQMLQAIYSKMKEPGDEK
jgi:hypothetical protein